MNIDNISGKVRKIILLGLSIIMLTPVISYGEQPRYVDNNSVSAIITDFDTGRIIYQKNPDKKLSMASITKMMTLLVTFDAIHNKKVNTDDVVEIIKSDVNREGTNMLLNAGDKIPLQELMEGMMIVSANDAALAISRYVGGNYEYFVKLMNDKAKEIGMSDTVFYNANGLPVAINNNVVENKTTARDVLTLSRELYKKYPKELTAITDKTRFVSKSKGINEENTNPLLTMLGAVDGLKTGYTGNAGYCLAYSMTTDKGDGNDSTNRLIGVSMGAPSKEARKDTTFNALKFISSNYKTKVLYGKDTKVAETKINGFDLLDTEIVSKNEIKVIKKDYEKFENSIEYNKLNIFTDLNKPIAYHVVKDTDNNLISKTDLYTEKPLSKTPFIYRMFIAMSSIVNDVLRIDKSSNYPIFTIFQ